MTEPTPFGFHDLKLAVEMVRVLKLPLGVVINRAGLDGSTAREFFRTSGFPSCRNPRRSKAGRGVFARRNGLRGVAGIRRFSGC